MAEDISTGNVEFLRTNPVQELVSTGEVPESYIHKDGDRGGDDVPSMEVPVIDLGVLLSSPTAEEEMEKLRSGLSSWGCFQVIKHGMTAEFLNEVREAAKGFFALSMEEKKRYSREEGGLEGYGNDMVLLKKQILDWTDRLYLTVHPETNRNLRYWPENPKQFREILNEYTKKVWLVMEVILKAMAKSLKLEEKCFIEQYGEEASMDVRFNYYPPCPRPELVLGVKPHADGSAITVLLQDGEVEGLQFLKDNQWFKCPIIPEALLVNIGDQAEITSNGTFKSPVHRVLTNSRRERISIAAFYLPQSDKDIEPLEGLIRESHPRHYKKVTNFVNLYFQYYQQEKRPIEAAKI